MGVVELCAVGGTAMHYCRRNIASVVGITLVLVFASGNAEAIVRGHGAGAIGRHVVRLVGQGGLSCSATVIGPQEVLTSSHCIDGSDPYFVIAGGRRIRVVGHGGYGGATRLTLASPLPRGYVPIAIDSSFGTGGALTIAGYGTAQESSRSRSGGLRAATVVPDRGASGALVDPRRRGDIGASACMGDSGGPVARFDGSRYVLMGIVDRASHPLPTRACGHRTHYVPVGGSGAWFGSGAMQTQAAVPSAPRRLKRRK